MKFRLHDEAHAEAVSAADYYESQQPGLGVVFTDLVFEAFRQIEQTPRRFAMLEATRLEGEIRRYLLPKFPYLVIYQLHPELIEVLAVAHASRSPDYWATRQASG